MDERDLRIASLEKTLACIRGIADASHQSAVTCRKRETRALKRISAKVNSAIGPKITQEEKSIIFTAESSAQPRGAYHEI